MSIDRKLISLSLVVVSWLPAQTLMGRETKGAKSPERVRQQALQALSGLPLVFEPNLGQTDPQVRFLTRAAGMTSFLTDRANVMVLSRRKASPDASEPDNTLEIEQAVVRMKLDGAKAPRSFEGLEKLESISNYFIGNIPSKWVTNVPNYRKVRASGVYPGIDLVYYGDGRKLEYDLVVSPGADPGVIRLAYEGADGLTTDQQGNLLIGIRGGTLVQRKPVVYQEVDGERREVHASYSIRSGKVELALADWDRKRDLVIDPVLEYSTYLGGTGVDQANSIAVDSFGAAYVTGNTNSSTDFPTQGAYQPTFGGGGYDAFVTKLNPSGTALVYSTYLGGSGIDYGTGIAVNGIGEAFVTGYTNSGSPQFPTLTFPTSHPAPQNTYGGGAYDAFVTRLSADGSQLLYSTYLGGSGNDQAKGIAVDSSNNAYVIGDTDSTDFKIPGNAIQRPFGGNRDAFVTKLDTHSADVVYFTYLGGSGQEVGYAIAVDEAGEAFAMGTTASSDFPTTPGAFQTTFVPAQDDFVSKLDTAGRTLVYSTYVGGGGEGTSGAIAVDSAAAAYVTGTTNSLNFPTTPGAFQQTIGGGQDAYVFKLNPSGNALVYSTYLGGNDADLGFGIAVDSSNAAYVTGFTYSTKFPTTSGALQPSLRGIYNAFVTKLDATGKFLHYSTYFGGSGRDQGTGIALDPSAVAYVTGYTQLSSGTNNFPTTPSAFEPMPPGGLDGFVVKLNLPTLGPPFAITVTGGGTQSASVGTAFTDPLQVKVVDQSNNPLPGVTVTFTAPSGSGATAVLSPTTSVTTDANGLASVTAVANLIAGAYTVTASASSGTGTLTATFGLTNVAGSATMISFTGQPTNTAAGSVIAPPVVVLLVDNHGNPISGAQVVMSVENGAASLGGTVTAMTDFTGHATFNNLVITTPGTYNLQATVSSTNLTATSNPFNITAGSAVSIKVLAGDNQTAAVGTAFAAPLHAIVYDGYNNPVPNASVTFSAPASGPSGVFAGSLTATVTTNASGIAISPPLTANSQAGAFQVTAITTNVTQGAIFTLTNAAVTADKLAFIDQPTNTAAGAVMAPVTVQLEDSSGAPVHTQGVAITLQLVPGQILSGTVSQTTDANGLAIFTDLSVQRVGQYQLLAMAASIVSATSHTFNITTGAAATIQASGGNQQSAIIHTVFGAPLQATVTDAAGNPVSGVAVVFAAPTSGASGLFGGQSTVTVPTDQNGHAAAVITANGIAGSFGVTASVAAITGSAMFSLENLPVGTSALAFVQQPTNTVAGQVINPPVTVRVLDASGQPVSVQGIPIVLSLSSGTGTLLGTLVQLTDPTGLATFSDLHIAEIGTKRLRATASQEIPADSNTFQITAGPPASITAIGGTPQVTTVSQLFPSLLRAQVRDSAGNPVSGLTVTFSVALSGPSGTFTGAVTLTTDSNGIVTAPALTANNLAGSFTVTATATGLASPATFALTNLPQQTSAIAVNPSTLIFASEINQPAPPGQTVLLATTMSWTVSSSASWLSASPASGSGSAQITVSVNPAGLAVGVYTGSIRITGSDGSVALVLVTYAITATPALVVTPPTLVFSTSSNTVAPAAQTLTASSTSQTIAYKVSAQVSTPSGGAWLQVSSAQGQTPGSVTVSVNPAGLSQGVYDGSVLFTPTQSGVNSVAVPVTLIVGCGEGGCVMEPNIITVLNGASFQPGGAPRAIMTIFGTNLSDATHQAASYPLSTVLGPTSVMVNGVAAPLFYVSPTQINFQMPSSAPATAVQVVVNNQTLSATRALRASQPHTSPLTAVDPGLFVTSDRRAAALNGDLSVHTAATPIPAGGYVILFLTGAGPVAPAIPDGVAAPASPLSIIDGTVQVNIGGQSATVTYQGVAPGFAGLEQLNVIVPAGLTPGDQPVFVTVNGAPSNAGVITVK